MKPRDRAEDLYSWLQGVSMEETPREDIVDFLDAVIRAAEEQARAEAYEDAAVLARGIDPDPDCHCGLEYKIANAIRARAAATKVKP